MSRYGKGICKSCQFAANCTLHSKDEYTWECSEYEQLVAFADIRSSLVSDRKIETPGQTTSLCGSCTLKENCCYYSPEIFIFHCENVQ
jgi:hypothetical protein